MLKGKQIVLDLYNCNYDILSNLSEMETCIAGLLKENEIETLSSFSQKYPDSNDFAVVYFHKNGHLIIHSFPDIGFASLDIFSNFSDSTLDKLAVKIKKYLRSEKSKDTYLRRGDFGSLNDMKPTIRKKTKVWRRVRNTSAKMFRLIVNKRNNNQNGPD